jgi:superfamily II DNA/RNA helicase
LDEFFDGHLPVLVCTDLAARGIDFPSLHHVIQYTPAATAEMHLHRCGRTARTGSEGPFIVTCLVDREADEVDDEVAKLMGLDVRGGGGGGGGREDAGGDPR